MFYPVRMHSFFTFAALMVMVVASTAKTNDLSHREKLAVGAPVDMVDGAGVMHPSDRTYGHFPFCKYFYKCKACKIIKKKVKVVIYGHIFFKLKTFLKCKTFCAKTDVCPKAGYKKCKCVHKCCK